MTTTQTTGHDLKRLCYLLGTMIEQLEGAEPENALGRIEEYEDEAAELIKTTGLADEAEIRDEFRPVFKRTMLGWEEFGIGDTPHEKHPTYVSYQFTESSGLIHIRKFDALTAMGLALPPLPEPLPGWKKAKPPAGSFAEKLMSMSSGGPPPLPEPDARFVQTLVVCLKGWRSRAQWKATGEVLDKREVIDDPIANHKLADLCDLDPDTVSIQMRKALIAAGRAVKTGGAGISRDWTHDQLRAAYAHLPDARLQKYLDSVGFGKPNETRF